MKEEVKKEEVKEEEVKEEEEEEEQKRGEEVEADLSMVSEGVSQEYALSCTLPQEERGEERGAEEEKGEE